MRLVFLCCLGWLVLVSSKGALAEKRAATVELRDGDRVALLGGTFIERMQLHGYFEAALTAGYPDANLSFRNLGWSGDTVWGEARAVFGTADDGFARLQKDLLETRPTVIAVAYGSNEAHAGSEGLPRFREGLNRLLDALQPSGARLVLLGPHRYIALGSPLPDPASYNEVLKQYDGVIQEVARERQLSYISLDELLASLETWVPLAELTDNGVHLNPLGYWYLGPSLARAFGADIGPWQLTIDYDSGLYEAQAVQVRTLAKTDAGVRVEVTDSHLPYSASPQALSRSPVWMQKSLRVRNLPTGKYEVRVDGQVLSTTRAAALANGISLSIPGTSEQVQALREAIELKNTYFFHRHRPQNETYLFLFRKHEQGNNAVEIPQFDPLIAEQESLIAKLRRPPTHTYEIVRVEQ